MQLAIIAAGFYGNFGWLYWIGVAVFAGMLIYQHSIVKPNDLRKVNLAFMTANGIASVVFAYLLSLICLLIKNLITIEINSLVHLTSTSYIACHAFFP